MRMTSIKLLILKELSQEGEWNFSKWSLYCGNTFKLLLIYTILSFKAAQLFLNFSKGSVPYSLNY